MLYDIFRLGRRKFFRKLNSSDFYIEMFPIRIMQPIDFTVRFESFYQLRKK